MRRLLVYICLILTTFIVKSQVFDYLKPDFSTLTDFDFSSDYKTQIRKKLLFDLSDFPIARILVCPSFEPEFAVSIETKLDKNRKEYDESKTYLILRTCYPSIWNSYLNKDNSSIVSTKEILIDSVFSQVLESLFKSALSKARFSLEPTDGVDGTNYYFMSSIEFEGVLCGYTWSPDSGTRMNELCEITVLLRKYCETNDVKVKNEIINKSNKLIERFEDNNMSEQKNNERYLWISLTTILITIIIFLIAKTKKTKANTAY